MEQAAKAGEYDYNGFVEAIRRSPMNDADKKIAQEKNFDLSPGGQRQEKLRN